MLFKFKNYMFLFVTVCMLFSFISLEAKTQRLKGKARVAHRSGQLYLKEEVYDKALEQYLIVINEDPTHVESIKNVADLYFLFSEQDEAKQKEYMETAHEYYVKTVDTILSISDWDKYDNFETILNDAKLKMRSIWVRIFKTGQDYFSESEYDKAINIFKELLVLAPDSVQSYQMLAVIADRQGDKEKAIEYSLKILEINPNNTQILINLAIESEEAGDFNKALEFYNKFAELEPQNSEVYMNMAIVYYKLDNYEKAMEYNEKAFELDPQNIDAIANAASFAQRLQNDQKAISLLKKLIEVERTPQNIEILCYTYARTEQWTELIKYAQMWHELDSKAIGAVDLIILGAHQSGNTELRSKYQAIRSKLK